MGNHEINCKVCGEDLRGLSGGHHRLCPWSGDKFYGAIEETKRAKKLFNKRIKNNGNSNDKLNAKD